MLASGANLVPRTRLIRELVDSFQPDFFHDQLSKIVLWPVVISLRMQTFVFFFCLNYNILYFFYASELVVILFLDTLMMFMFLH